MVKLGKGTVGEVWLGRINESKKFTAIKVSIDRSARRHLLNEYEILKAIEGLGDHPNIIKCIEYVSKTKMFLNETMTEEKISYLALEYAQNRNLLEYLIY